MLERSASVGFIPTWTPDEYDQLLAIARQIAGASGTDKTLSPRNLISEGWVRLVAQRKDLEFTNVEHYRRAMAVAMKHALIDYERRRVRKKRGHGWAPSSLEPSVTRNNTVPDTVARLIRDLAQEQPEIANVAALRCYYGYSIGEIGNLLDLSERTIARRWKAAKRFLADGLDR